MMIGQTRHRYSLRAAFVAALILLGGARYGAAQQQDQPASGPPSAERGFDLLVNKAYLPPDFDQATFDSTWRVWEEPLRSQAAAASPEVRRQMAFRRYGLIARPNDPLGRSLQYVVDAQGNWIMNCLACHQGKVAGIAAPGVPNSLLALETLTEDIRATKILGAKKLARMELGSMLMPLGTTVGTTNAVNFGVALMAFRDADLNVHPERQVPPMVHHDLDAPAWWHYHRKARLYADDFAPRGHRMLMQFLLDEQNGPAKFREWEDDFHSIEAYLDSLTAPKYPYAIDEQLAALGRTAFSRVCAECHGTYGAEGKYPEKTVPLDEVATDPLRFRAISAKQRRELGQSWFGDHGRMPTLAEPVGYLAPPLDGIWASAPYLHNGSVPTLWHLLHPAARPTVWRRSEDGYDQEKVGLEVRTFDALPADIHSNADRRWYFDTRKSGKSAAGHDFPDVLSEAEKRAVLEYLKTL